MITTARPDPYYDAPAAGAPGESHHARRRYGRRESVHCLYDFGDSWERPCHGRKTFMPAQPEAKLPMCLAGANACPPEDVGGPPGYAEFLEAIADTGSTAIAQKCWTGAAENSIPRRSASTTSTPLCASSKLDRQDGLALTLTNHSHRPRPDALLHKYAVDHV